jgi:hypothetical protein
MVGSGYIDAPVSLQKTHILSSLNLFIKEATEGRNNFAITIIGLKDGSTQTDRCDNEVLPCLGEGLI